MLSSLDNVMQVLSQLGSVLQLQLSPQMQRAYDEMALAALDVAACALPPSNATQGRLCVHVHALHTKCRCRLC